MLNSPAKNVAICTERVEAKNMEGLMRGDYKVAICTERVEAKRQQRLH